jgi:ABC-type enterochelin transport system permease subunit
VTPSREPALLILGLIAAVVQMVSAFLFPLTIDQQGVLNAVAVAIAGVITAAMVRSDQLAPAVLGAVQAILALGLAFGLNLAPEQQSVVMTFTAAVVAMFIRTQVQAPVPARVVT